MNSIRRPPHSLSVHSCTATSVIPTTQMPAYLTNLVGLHGGELPLLLRAESGKHGVAVQLAGHGLLLLLLRLLLSGVDYILSHADQLLQAEVGLGHGELQCHLGQLHEHLPLFSYTPENIEPRYGVEFAPDEGGGRFMLCKSVL